MTQRVGLAVVGGGIAGLAAAWFAAEAGLDVLVLEASPAVGGKLRVAEVGGTAVDVGAEALLTARPEGVDLVAAVGLEPERIAPSTTSAAVRAGGAAHPLPAKTMMGVPADPSTVAASGVLSAAGLEALRAEPGLPPLEPLVGDVAVGALVRARMGDEVADRLVEPLLGGVYAGRADQLSLRATMGALSRHLADHGGSLLEAAAAVTDVGTRARGAGSIFTSLQGGLGRLPVALVESGRFAVRTGTTVRAVGRTASGLVLECGAPEVERIEADAVVVAAPAAKAARLLSAVAPAAAEELAAIEYASMAIVSFAFDDGVELPEGSGLLVGAGERLATKAVTLSSNKWPIGGRVLRASVGRVGEPHALQFDDAELTELVRRELRPLVGITAAPLDTLVTRWGGGLPQYSVGHTERVRRIRRAVDAVPGLAVCGAAYDGVGVPACIGTARAAVERITATLNG